MAKSTSKSRKLKERTKLEKILLAVLIALILFLLLASHYSWWPFSSQFGGDNLGTAFYTATAPATAGTSGGTSSGSSGANGSNGSNGSSGTNGGTTTTPPATDTSSSILTFAAGVNTGDTKEQVSGQANGLDQNCSVLVTASAVGKQEVCTYTQGDKVVTVTYLNDHVVSASRSGF